MKKINTRNFFNENTYWNELIKNLILNENDVKKIIFLFTKHSEKFSNEIFDKIKTTKTKTDWMYLQKEIFEDDFAENENILFKFYDFFNTYKTHYDFFLKHYSYSFNFEGNIDVTNIDELRKYKNNKLIMDNLFHKIVLVMFGKINKIFTTDYDFVFLKSYIDIKDKEIKILKKEISSSDLFFKKIQDISLNFETLYLMDQNNKKINEELIKENKEKCSNNYKLPIINEELVEFISTLDFEPSYKGLSQKLKEIGLIDSSAGDNALYISARNKGLDKEISKIIKNKRKQNKKY